VAAASELTLVYENLLKADGYGMYSEHRADLPTVRCAIEVVPGLTIGKGVESSRTESYCR